MNKAKFKISQALVALDLSDTDDKVLEYIDFLNQEVRIDSIYFLHVVKKANFFTNLFYRDTSALQSQFVLNEDIIKHFIDGVESKLGNLEDINVEYEVREGKPLHEIIDQVTEHHAELVIIGKKPHTESSGLLGNSLARRSPSSVWFVPQHTKKQLRVMLVPVDFSENSGRALQRALDINDARKHPAKIICLHVYDMPDLSYYKINKNFEQLKEIVEGDMNEAFDNFLEKYIPNLKDIVEKQVVERTQLSTAGHIHSLAEEWGTDLLIVGAKGHTPLERLLLGSVTEKLIQLNETIPTLIVR